MEDDEASGSKDSDFYFLNICMRTADMRLDLKVLIVCGEIGKGDVWKYSH